MCRKTSGLRLIRGETLLGLGHRRPLLLGVGAVVVVAAAVLAVVVWTGGSDEPVKAGGQTTSKPAPTLSPLRIGTDPLWTTPDGAGMELRDDVALVYGPYEDLSLVDVTTGKTQWTLKKLADLDGTGASWRTSLAAAPGQQYLVGHGDDLGLLVEYYAYSSGCTRPPGHPDGRGVCNAGPKDEAGLALLSAKNGKLVWKTPTIRSFPADYDIDTWPEQILRIVDDRVALINITTGHPFLPDYNRGTKRTIAIDVRTGARLWQQSDGVWPATIVGDTVLGQVSKKLPERTNQGTVVALDLATGARRWELSEPFASGGLDLVAGDSALVWGTDRPSVVDVETGRRLAEFPKGSGDCVGDGGSMIACDFKDGTEYGVTIFRAADSKVTKVARSTTSEMDVLEAWQGRISIAVTTADVDRTVSYRTLDGAGNTIDDKLPGELVELSEYHAIFRVGTSGEESYEVYQRNG